MNAAFTRSQYNGFRLNDTLASKFKFSGVIRVSDIGRRTRQTFEGLEEPYWIIRDDNGARLSLFDKKLFELAMIGERYVVKGEVRIGKGGTFLNITEMDVLNGNDFTEKENKNA